MTALKRKIIIVKNDDCKDCYENGKKVGCKKCIIEDQTHCLKMTDDEATKMWNEFKERINFKKHFKTKKSSVLFMLFADEFFPFLQEMKDMGTVHFLANATESQVDAIFKTWIEDNQDKVKLLEQAMKAMDLKDSYSFKD